MEEKRNQERFEVLNVRLMGMWDNLENIVKLTNILHNNRGGERVCIRPADICTPKLSELNIMSKSDYNNKIWLDCLKEVLHNKDCRVILAK